MQTSATKRIFVHLRLRECSSLLSAKNEPRGFLCSALRRQKLSYSQQFSNSHRTQHGYNTKTFDNSRFHNSLKNKDFDDIRELLAESEKNGISVYLSKYNSLITLLCQEGLFEEALTYLGTVKARQQLTDDAVLPFIVYSCEQGSIGRATQFYEEYRLRLNPDKLLRPIVSYYASRKEVEAAVKLFQQEYHRNEKWSFPQCFTVLIQMYQSMNRFEEAKVLAKQAYNGVVDTVLAVAIVNLYCKSGDLKQALLLAQNLAKRTKAPTINPIVVAMCQSGNVDEAVALVKERVAEQPHNSNLTTHTIAPIVEELVRQRREVDAIKALAELIPNLELSAAVFNGMIKQFLEQGNYESAITIMGNAESRNVSPDVISYNMLINYFVEKGDMIEAGNVFQKMTNAGVEPTIITVSTLIKGYIKQAHGEKIEELQEITASKNIETNDRYYAQLIDYYSSMHNTEKVQQILDIAKKRQYIEVYHSLMFSMIKQRNVQAAKELFEELKATGWPLRAFTYNLMIKAYILLGDQQQAIRLLREMQVTKVKPDARTEEFMAQLHVPAELRDSLKV